MPNGIVTSYDTASQLAGITYTLGSTSLGYGFDNDGSRTSVTGSFARTGLPNAVSTTAYNANNQLTTWGTANLFYDANANMTSDGTHSYTWDARNRLSQIDLGNTGTFVYDTFRRRVSKTILSTQTSFLYDNADLPPGSAHGDNKLREALGDSAHNPRFIETLPRRGYRFIAPVAGVDGTTSGTTMGARAVAPTRGRKIAVAAAIGVLAAGTAGGLLWRGRHARHLAERDTIVLGDFANSTGDAVFDGTLREGLSVELEQSPFLSLLSKEGIHRTLRMMGQPVNA